MLTKKELTILRQLLISQGFIGRTQNRDLVAKLTDLIEGRK